MTEAQNSFREQLAREVESAQARWQALSKPQSRLRRRKPPSASWKKRRIFAAKFLKKCEKRARHNWKVDRSSVLVNWKKLWREPIKPRRNWSITRIASKQFSSRRLDGFQSQLDDVLSLHRNELHRQSDSLFEEIHDRIRSSFEAANSKALETFDSQIQSLVQPHVTKAEEAVHRLAGGRSLLDAAMTMQQDRIRNSADEAFADSLARFRENLGSVEQILNESAQTITARNMEELENKAVDLKHHTMEEMFKSAEWYEKRAQTQAQTFTEKLVEQSTSPIAGKGGRDFRPFATELDHSSRSYLDQSHHQLEDTVARRFQEGSHALYRSR